MVLYIQLNIYQNICIDSLQNRFFLLVVDHGSFRSNACQPSINSDIGTLHSRLVGLTLVHAGQWCRAHQF